MSDIHAGYRSRGLDGAQWLARAIDDLDRNLRAIDYGLTLGDITHSGDRRSLRRYLDLRDKSGVPRWLELAGNHEHHHGGIAHYRELVGEPAPALHLDGNIAWILVSDEDKHCPGELSRSSREWLRKTLEQHRDKVIILCSHQPPPRTVRRSDERIFSLRPRGAIAEIIERHPIALHLCGHEHHRPYGSDCIAASHGTVVINVASINHAYDTDESASVLLEIEDDAKQIVARRRSHDRRAFRRRYEIRVPLPTRISLDSPVPAAARKRRQSVSRDGTECRSTRRRRRDPRP
jgi:hypothetical protein